MTQARKSTRDGYAHQKQKSTNPLLQGIQLFFAKQLSMHKFEAVAVQDLPKRYTVYEPMLLLPSTFFTQSPNWQTVCASLEPCDIEVLFASIASAFCNAGQRITNIAVNAPIERNLSREDAEEENIMRSPVNLEALYGDFGPDNLLSSKGPQPSQVDFDAAFWVTTSQLNGIKQVWAPRWTMFSRGNIREKSRVLGQQGVFPGLTGTDLEQSISEADVVDFYVGIGYFAFPYLRRGVRKVIGWEINGWSVEGVRRGCLKNGWKCLVVKVEDDDHSVQKAMDVVAEASHGHDAPRCIVFWGDNRFASGVLSAWDKSGFQLNIRHCNLGLLPTSRCSWQSAIEVLDNHRGGWLHVHENCKILEVEHKKVAVLDVLKSIVQSVKGTDWQILCEHTEMVKTYAPGVGHYVFDIKIWPGG